MSVVIPAVLVHSRKSLEDTLARLDGLVDRVQISIVDGRFAGPPTWPYTEDAELKILNGEGEFPRLGRFKFEVDLMVENPETTLGPWIEAGAARILVHIETLRNFDALLKVLESYGHEKGFAPDLLSFGVAINIDTDIAVLEPYIDSIDYVQFMGTATIGIQGRPFDTRVIRKIETFRKRHPDMMVQAAGGITLEAARQLLAAGVTNLCVGSALLKSSDIAEALHTFEVLAEDYGRYR